MNSDQIKGKMQNAFGKTEEAVGEAVGSRNLSNAGAEDRVKGAAKETWGNAKEAVHEMNETARTRADVTTGQPITARDKFAAGAEHIKDSSNTRMEEIKTYEQGKREQLRRTA
ncbi:CsbD family protein [Terriglobus sp. RCC_193]|uniref:CsbD family protein n=1 Tax=Terriglobus sp. RCC_193 TaxID=3239218 RepID=UPI0035233139